MYSTVDGKSYYLRDAIADVYGSKANIQNDEVNQRWMNNESPWNKDGNWKMRYYRLYTDKRLSLSNKGGADKPAHRISFLGETTTPYARHMRKMRDSLTASDTQENATAINDNENSTTILASQSDLYDNSIQIQSENLGGHDMKLLNMVRERVRQSLDSQVKMLELTKEEETEEDEAASEICMHGLSMRMTDRSISRSRFSRVSTRRDMDIPSILAFTTTITPAPNAIPAFPSTAGQEKEKAPRWSIRRSVCPVCSQKWKDRSSIKNVKNSGLKRNSSLDVPSVKAPAKLRTSITMGYTPRPALVTVDEDEGVVSGRLRNSSVNAPWQLTRARRFRPPKPQMISSEAIDPSSASAALARKDLDLRLNRFLTDQVKDSSQKYF